MPKKSTPLFWLSGILSSCLLPSSLSTGLHAISGVVEAGNYSYYVLKYDGPISLELTSLEGDADLYVSDVVQHPTFDLEEHGLSSWTTGVDKIVIPKSFGRPINIGVYGYPRYPENQYVLTADFLGEHEFDHFEDTAKHDSDYQREDRYESETTRRQHPDQDHDHDDNEKEPQMKTLIASTLYWILEILINILTAL